MSTEIPLFYNEIKKEFDQAMDNANGDGFVEKPKALLSLTKRRREFIKDCRSQNRNAIKTLREDSDELCKTYAIDSLKAKDLILTAWNYEERLFNEGAIFNDKAFNFALERASVFQNDKETIENTSLTLLNSLQELGKQDLKKMFSFLPLNPVEEMFENLNLLPNSARIDFILTDEGPKVIEINSQWVDAISALSAFQKEFGQPNEYKPIDVFSEKVFGKRLAIIDVNQSRALSKTSGASRELESLARKISRTRKPPVRCEVVKPDYASLKYLNQFNCYYLNCDPRYFQFEIPEWLVNIVERVKVGEATIFPNWRPLLDKKYVLSLIKNPAVVPTYPLSRNFSFDNSSPAVIKGDGYSLNTVTTSFDPNFGEMLDYALTEPDAYVVQPYIEGMRADTWVFDTSNRKVKLIKNAYSKLNVWVLDYKVAGMLLSVSNSQLISDKDYNSLPIFRKENR